MSENEQDFDALRRLLALKRHEIPPPGYFENFSGSVIARIRAGESAAELPLLLRFLQWFERRPAFPVAFASSLCLFLLYGIVTVQQTPGMAVGFGEPGQMGGLSTISTSPTGIADANQPFNGGSSETNSPINLSANDSALFGSPASTPSYQQGGFSPAGN
jgi:hypothetical protein